MDEDSALTAVPGESRPWTLAAAMEPLPPLAPPPARPGSGVAMGISRPGRRGPGPLATAATVVVILVAVAVILALVLTVGR